MIKLFLLELTFRELRTLSFTPPGNLGFFKSSKLIPLWILDNSLLVAQMGHCEIYIRKCKIMFFVSIYIWIYWNLVESKWGWLSSLILVNFIKTKKRLIMPIFISLTAHPFWNWKYWYIYLFIISCILRIPYPFQDKRYTINLNHKGYEFFRQRIFLSKWCSFLLMGSGLLELYYHYHVI